VISSLTAESPTIGSFKLILRAEGLSGMEHVSIEVRTGRDTDPPSLLIMLPVVSSAVFLSVGPSLIAVAFRFAMMVRKAAVGRGKMRKEGEEAGKHALLIKLQA
jgi:hypothetical protein